MPNGYNGKILHVYLDEGRLEVEEPGEAFYRQYMGGSAMGLAYLLRELPAGIDPLSPENILTLFTSVTTGVPISGQSRINANAKSPMSGAIGDSQGGGFFPAELKFAGFDGIVVRGRSKTPVYLSILNGKPSLHDASPLMGKLTAEVDEILRTVTGEPKAEVLQCGPGAENGVLFASLVSMANRNNGRTGMGAVMASKNLKAIVVKGKARPQIFDQKALTALSKLGPVWFKDNPDVEDMQVNGTAGVVMINNAAGTLPTRNYSMGQFEYAEDISPETMNETILKGNDTCFACLVRCKRVVEVEQGKFQADPIYGGPEYETIATFGSYCAVNDLAAISQANQICNAYGVDTITCGATIAFAMECFEKGIIGLGDTGGIDLRFGNAEAMIAVLEQIVANKTPLGRILSQGSARAAKIWGPKAEALLITVKNEEAPAHMPQAKKSLALIYAVNPFGADHQSHEHDWAYEEGAAPLTVERLALLGFTTPTPADDFGPEKVRFAVMGHQFYSMLDTLELCQFVWGPAWTLYGPAEIVELVRSVTGWDVTLDELMALGRRRLNMMRQFNVREGFGRAQDDLPEKYFTPLEGEGPTAGVAVDRSDFEAARELYYQLNGWDEEGRPKEKTLQELNLAWTA